MRRAVFLFLTLLSFAAGGGPLLLPAAGVGAPRVDRLLLLDAAQTGTRIVAVGERGRIVLSDDEGHSWRYAASPTEATLTAVHFAGDRRGWAVGHDATILLSRDGGETWDQVHAAPGAAARGRVGNHFASRPSSTPNAVRSDTFVGAPRG